MRYCHQKKEKLNKNLLFSLDFDVYLLYNLGKAE